MPQMASALGLVFCLFTFFYPEFSFFKCTSFFAGVVVLKICIFFFCKEECMVESLGKLAVKGYTAEMQFVKRRILWLCK